MDTEDMKALNRAFDKHAPDCRFTNKFGSYTVTFDYSKEIQFQVNDDHGARRALRRLDPSSGGGGGGGGGYNNAPQTIIKRPDPVAMDKDMMMAMHSAGMFGGMLLFSGHHIIGAAIILASMILLVIFMTRGAWWSHGHHHAPQVITKRPDPVAMDKPMMMAMHSAGMFGGISHHFRVIILSVMICGQE